MTETAAVVGADFPDPMFEVTEFRPDGGYTSKGSGLLLISSMAAGAALGALASVIGQVGFYLIVIFPLVIGMGVGGVGMWAIKAGKVRNPILAGLAGLLAGGFASLAMHYTDYLYFQSEFREDLKRMVRELAVRPGPKVPAVALDVDAIVNQAKMPTFFEYIDEAAVAGVMINPVAHGGGGGGMNLGYVGTYIYWIVEALIVAFVALAITHQSAAAPFCTACESWKSSRTLGNVVGSPESVLDVLRAGRPGQLRRFQPTPNAGELVVTIWTCPNCGQAAPIEVKLQHVTRNAKNEVKTKDLGCFTYPGEALPVLDAMFQPMVVEEVQPADEAKPKPEADPHS